jgi:hypothetical protein
MRSPVAKAARRMRSLRGKQLKRKAYPKSAEEPAPMMNPFKAKYVKKTCRIASWWISESKSDFDCMSAEHDQ